MIADSVVQDAVFVSRLAVGAVVWTVVRVVSCCVQCVFCYAGSELVFVGFFSESFSPLVGFFLCFFPLVDVGHHPPKCCSFFACAPSSGVCSVFYDQ